MAKTRYRNKIDAMLGILPSEVDKFDVKKHSRTRPESKRKAFASEESCLG